MVGLFLAFVMALGIFIKFTFFPSEKEDQRNPIARIRLPKPDPKEFKSDTKLSAYGRSKVDVEDRGDFLWKDNVKEQLEEGFDLDLFGDNPAGAKDDGASMYGDTTNIDKQMQELIKMQEELDKKEKEKYLNHTASQKPFGGFKRGNKKNAVNKAAKTSKKAKPKGKTLAQRWKERESNSKGQFKGVSGFGKADDKNQLVSCETIDQRLIVNGTTVAIRLKEALYIEESNFTIPKDAVLYGKAQFQGLDRMNINIRFYKEENKNFPISVKVYDFDGLEGIHLDNNTWPKIPPKVVKQVAQYARRKGLNPGNGIVGNNNQIDPEEIKTIAQLTALNETLKELIDRRKVHMYRKYHLWIKVVPQSL